MQTWLNKVMRVVVEERGRPQRKLRKAPKVRNDAGNNAGGSAAGSFVPTPAARPMKQQMFNQYKRQLRRWAENAPGGSPERRARDLATKRIEGWCKNRLTDKRWNDVLGLPEFGLSEIPPLPEGVRRVDLTGNRIEMLAGLHNLPRSLNHLNLAGNPLKRLDEYEPVTKNPQLQVRLGATELSAETKAVIQAVAPNLIFDPAVSEPLPEPSRLASASNANAAPTADQTIASKLFAWAYRTGNEAVTAARLGIYDRVINLQDRPTGASEQPKPQTATGGSPSASGTDDALRHALMQWVQGAGADDVGARIDIYEAAMRLLNPPSGHAAETTMPAARREEAPPDLRSESRASRRVTLPASADASETSGSPAASSPHSGRSAGAPISPASTAEKLRALYSRAGVTVRPSLHRPLPAPPLPAQAAKTIHAPTSEYESALREWSCQIDANHAEHKDRHEAVNRVMQGLQNGDIRHLKLHDLKALTSLPPVPQGTVRVTAPMSDALNDAIQNLEAKGIAVDQFGTRPSSPRPFQYRAPAHRGSVHHVGDTTGSVARSGHTKNYEKIIAEIRDYSLTSLDTWLADQYPGEANELRRGDIRAKILDQLLEKIDTVDLDLTEIPGNLPPLPNYVKSVILGERRFMNDEVKSLPRGVHVTFQSLPRDFSHLRHPITEQQRHSPTLDQRTTPLDHGRLHDASIISPKAKQEIQKRLTEWRLAQASAVGKNKHSQTVLNLSNLELPSIPFNLLPADVKEVNLSGNRITSLKLKDLPPKITLNLENNPLQDIDCDGTPPDITGHINLGKIKIKPRILRRAAIYQNLGLTYNGLLGFGAYSEDWEHKRSTLNDWMRQEGLTPEEGRGRKIAVDRLEEWLHGDEKQTRDTPLDLQNLHLSELFPIWPHTKKPTYIMARGNRLKEIPLHNIPGSVKLLDLRDNLISEMPPALTSDQLAQLAAKKFKPRESGTEDFFNKFKSTLGLNDKRVIHPQERSGLLVLLNGNQVPLKEQENYNGRAEGPEYIFNRDQLKAYRVETISNALGDVQLLPYLYGWRLSGGS